jgi:hypothetical protein
MPGEAGVARLLHWCKLQLQLRDPVDIRRPPRFTFGLDSGSMICVLQKGCGVCLRLLLLGATGWADPLRIKVQSRVSF